MSLLLLLCVSSVSAAPGDHSRSVLPFFLPPGCAPADSPALTCAALLADYQAELEDFSSRLSSVPADVARAIGLNATLRAIRGAVDANMHVLRALLAMPPPLTIGIDDPAVAHSSRSRLCASASSGTYASATDVLAHLARDWSNGSPASRASSALASLLKRFMPPRSRGGRRARALVPGAGACGLAVELAESGYVVEANDVSLPMLSAARALLAAAAAHPCAPPWPVRPHVLADMNVRVRARQLEPSMISACSGTRGRRARVEALGRLSFQLGSFSDDALYAGSAAPDRNGTSAALRGGRTGWDAIVTSFFLDAVPSPPHDLVARVRAVLRPGGVWLFSGPLAYHEKAVPPLSMDELLALLPSRGFSVRATRLLTVEGYAPASPRIGRLQRAAQALVAGVCSLVGAASLLTPAACAPLGSMARNGYNAHVFVAVATGT